MESSIDSRLGGANLPLFYREVWTLVEEQVSSEQGQNCSQSNADSPPIKQMKSISLEQNINHGRTILRDSLPDQEVSQHLLDLFFDYQNTIFFVWSKEEARSQLFLMYEDPNQVSLSCYCQMFLLFSVAIQFDGVNEDDGARYYDLGRKYIDDAIDESPQNTLWIIRAMLLLCFYEPPTKWSSIWIYLGNTTAGIKHWLVKLTINRCSDSRCSKIPT